MPVTPDVSLTIEEVADFARERNLTTTQLFAICDAHRTHFTYAHTLPESVWTTPLPERSVTLPGPGRPRAPVGVWSPLNYKPDGSAQRWRWREDGTRERRYEHQLVMERHLGRPLAPDEFVRHHDGEKSNNAIGNLVLCSRLWPADKSVAALVEHARAILAAYPDGAPELDADAPADTPEIGEVD